MLSRKELITQAIKSCKYQDDLSIDSVKRYVRACEYIYKNDSYLTVTDIINLGNIISKKNNGFRCTPVIFKDGNKGVHYAQIPRLIENICMARKEYRITVREFFIQFELIHPFNDGNGRVGEILFWWMIGNFYSPEEYFTRKI